jgi:hypothetical protein
MILERGKRGEERRKNPFGKDERRRKRCERILETGG